MCICNYISTTYYRGKAHGFVAQSGRALNRIDIRGCPRFESEQSLHRARTWNTPAYSFMVFLLYMTTSR